MLRHNYHRHQHEKQQYHWLILFHDGTNSYWIIKHLRWTQRHHKPEHQRRIKSRNAQRPSKIYEPDFFQNCQHQLGGTETIQVHRPAKMIYCHRRYCRQYTHQFAASRQQVKQIHYGNHQQQTSDERKIEINIVEAHHRNGVAGQRSRPQCHQGNARTRFARGNAGLHAHQRRATQECLCECPSPG